MSFATLCVCVVSYFSHRHVFIYFQERFADANSVHKILPSCLPESGIWSKWISFSKILARFQNAVSFDWINERHNVFFFYNFLSTLPCKCFIVELEKLIVPQLRNSLNNGHDTTFSPHIKTVDRFRIKSYESKLKISLYAKTLYSISKISTNALFCRTKNYE